MNIDFIDVPEYQSWEDLCKDETFLEIYDMYNQQHLAWSHMDDFSDYPLDYCAIIDGGSIE